MPRPANLSSPPGRTSATTAMTLLVPMSSPTTRSLYSFAISLPFCFPVLFAAQHRGGDASELECIPIAVTQVGRLEIAAVPAGHLCQRGDEALGTAVDLVEGAQPQLDAPPVLEPGPPAAAGHQLQQFQPRVHFFEHRGQPAVTRQNQHGLALRSV